MASFSGYINTIVSNNTFWLRLGLRVMIRIFCRCIVQDLLLLLLDWCYDHEFVIASLIDWSRPHSYWLAWSNWSLSSFGYTWLSSRRPWSLLSADCSRMTSTITLNQALLKEESPFILAQNVIHTLHEIIKLTCPFKICPCRRAIMC